MSVSICFGYSMGVLVGLMGRETLGMEPVRNGGSTPISVLQELSTKVEFAMTDTAADTYIVIVVLALG